MKITPVPHGLDLLASDLVRSPGLHMSTIYNSLFKLLEPKRYGGEGVISPVMTAVGTAWEHHLEYLIHKAGIEVTRPGELIVHVDRTPIVYSPDGLLDGNTRLAEYKVAWWMSSRNMPREPCTSFPSKLDKYINQMQVYCFPMELNASRIYILFVQGPGRNPELLVYDIEFTSAELRQAWDMNMNHARREGLI